jgi:hypothetical protein
MITDTSTSPPRNTPSPSNILGSSTQELYDSGTFQTDAFANDSAFVKPCGKYTLFLLFHYFYVLYLTTSQKGYVSGIKLKVPAEFGLSDHTAVLHEDNMYIYGGVSVDNNLPPTIQVFNFGISSSFSICSHFHLRTASRSFSTIAPASAPIPRYQHTAVVSDGQMIVFGGGAENVFLNDLVAFSFGMYKLTHL